MSIADAALLAEAIRSAFNGYGRNSKSILGRSSKKKKSRAQARQPLGIHHKEQFVLSTYTGLVRDALYNNILLINQGFKDDERTGRIIKPRMFVFTGIVALDMTNIQPAVLVKLDLILDKQPDGEEATTEEIWTEPTANSLAIALPNLHGAPRFQFLASRTFELDVYNPGKSVFVQVPLSFTTTYGETTGATTATKDVLTNSLLWSIRVLGSDGALSSTVKMTGQTRVLYTD